MAGTLKRQKLLLRELREIKLHNLILCCLCLIIYREMINMSLVSFFIEPYQIDHSYNQLVL